MSRSNSAARDALDQTATLKFSEWNACPVSALMKFELTPVGNVQVHGMHSNQPAHPDIPNLVRACA